MTRVPLRRIRPGSGTRPTKSSPIRERIVRLARLTVALVLGGAQGVPCSGLSEMFGEDPKELKQDFDALGLQ